MAYDEHLANRIRDLLSDSRGLSEKRMFGGLAFLIHGNMAIAASGQGGILVRVPPEDTERLTVSAGAEIAVMRGRKMRGWIRVAEDQVRTKRKLQRWVGLGRSFASGLPKKR